MKPLIFLTVCQFKNGIIRAASSPRRLIGLLFFFGYYFFVFLRPGIISGGRAFHAGPLSGQLEFPPIQLVQALVFSALAIMSLFLMMGSGMQQAAFKQADVDVLFATPISPKIVLVFRIARDYFLTLIVPIIIVLFGIQPARRGFDEIFRNFPNPHYGMMTLRALSLGWLLIALMWVSFNYAVSLFINRSDMTSDRNKNILSWGFVAVAISIIAYVSIEARNMPEVAHWVKFSEGPIMRSLFFPATLALWLVLAPLTGSWWFGAMGLIGLVGLITVAIRVALSQAHWMYDQAAVKGFQSETIRAMSRTGDMFGVAAEKARQGKLRAKPSSWLYKSQIRGFWSLLWKEAFLLTRGMRSMLYTLLLTTIFMLVFPILMPNTLGRSGTVAVLLIFQLSSVLSITLPLAQVGFIEWLRRVDLLKPLPFAASKMAMAEAIAKACLSVAGSIIGAIGVAIAKPSLAAECLACVILVIGLSLLMSSTVLLVTVLFPDVDDHTQRQFRGLVTVLGVFVFGSVPVGMFLGTWILLGWNPILAAILPMLASGVIFWWLCQMSGKLYESYNPSE